MKIGWSLLSGRVREGSFRGPVLMFFLFSGRGWQFVPFVHELQHDVLLELLFLEQLFLLVTLILLHEDADLRLEELLPFVLGI